MHDIMISSTHPTCLEEKTTHKHPKNEVYSHQILRDPISSLHPIQGTWVLFGVDTEGPGGPVRAWYVMNIRTTVESKLIAKYSK